MCLKDRALLELSIIKVITLLSQHCPTPPTGTHLGSDNFSIICSFDKCKRQKQILCSPDLVLPSFWGLGLGWKTSPRW